VVHAWLMALRLREAAAGRPQGEPVDHRRWLQLRSDRAHKLAAHERRQFQVGVGGGVGGGVEVGRGWGWGWGWAWGWGWGERGGERHTNHRPPPPDGACRQGARPVGETPRGARAAGR
jgi:hypothetical protein